MGKTTNSERLATIEATLNAHAKASDLWHNRHDKLHDKIDVKLDDSVSKKGVKWMLGIIILMLSVASGVMAYMG